MGLTHIIASVCPGSSWLRWPGAVNPHWLDSLHIGLVSSRNSIQINTFL